jgi:cysteine desulfurase/selenocysteine lyase
METIVRTAGYDVDALRASEFPWASAGESIFFNHASTGPLPQRTLRATAEFNEVRGAPHRMSDTLQFNTLAHSRELIAQLIGARVREVALATNTTYGINLAAFSLPLGRGDVVLTPDLEFPANIYPWMEAARRRGFEHRLIPAPSGVIDTESILAALDAPNVRALSVSWVGFASGACVDLKMLGDACRDRDIYFVVDAIQGLGPLTIDLSALGVDIFACGAQKWLLSPWGSGFVYVREALLEQLDPHDVSWLAVKCSDDFTRLLDYDLTWREDARKFEFITLPFQDFAGMNASLELLHELGPAAVSAHIVGLGDHVVEWVEGRDDQTLFTPADRSRRGGIVSVRPRDPQATSVRLRAAGVMHSLREGAIRLSPHAYNTIDEVDRALEVIADG